MPFRPSIGIRQGCPISANLFVVTLESLANVKRWNPHIEGLKIGDSEFEIVQHTDDTCLFLKSEGDLKLALITLNLFTKYSRLKVTMDNSDAVFIGVSSNYRHKHFNLRWTTGDVRCLGIQIINNMKTMQEISYKERLSKIKALADLWCSRKLTSNDRCRHKHICTKWIDQRIQNLITSFIWNNKPPKVKYKVMINTVENGGLGLQDLESKLKSVRTIWIKTKLTQIITQPGQNI